MADSKGQFKKITYSLTRKQPKENGEKVKNKNPWKLVYNGKLGINIRGLKKAAQTEISEKSAEWGRQQVQKQNSIPQGESGKKKKAGRD